MKILNKEVYDKYVEVNTDGYGRAVLRYAEQWANAMERKIDNGEKLSDVAKQASYDADTEGFTGFQYNMAIQFLVKCWEYGEELRKWHNGEYDHDGDGIVNSSILKVKRGD